MHHVRLFIYTALALVLLLPGCSSTGPTHPVDPELSIKAKSARAAFNRGEFALATLLYHEALQRARLMDDAGEIGNNAYNLAACYLEEGNYDRPGPLLIEARQAFLRLGAIPPDLLLLEARTAFLQGRMEETDRLIREGLEEEQEPLQPAYRGQFLLLKARLDLAAGDPEGAEKRLKAAGEDLAETEDISLDAEYAALEGDLQLLRGAFGPAGKAFDRQAELLRRQRRYRSMARVLGKSGEAYLRADDFCRAGDRFFRSARSLFARKDMTGSLAMIQSALEAMEDCDQGALREEIRGLFEDIKTIAEVSPTEAPPEK